MEQIGGPPETPVAGVGDASRSDHCSEDRRGVSACILIHYDNLQKRVTGSPQGDFDALLDTLKRVDGRLLPFTQVLLVELRRVSKASWQPEFFVPQ